MASTLTEIPGLCSYEGRIEKPPDEMSAYAYYTVQIA